MSQPKVITLSPDGADRNGISTTETLLSTRLDYLINGALSTGYDRDGVGASQTPASAAAMTLNGALGTNFRDRKGVYVLLYGAADETGRTFTVVGLDFYKNRITEDITGPDEGLIVLGATKFYDITSVTPDAATAGAIEIGVNGYAEFSTPQHATSYHAGTDVGDVDTVYGYDRHDNYVTDALVAVNAAISSTQDQNFAHIDRITAAPAPAGATEFGVDGKCESGWHVLNYRGPDFNVGIGCSTGGATYAMQHTFTNVLAKGFVENDAVVLTHPTLTGETTSQDGGYTNPPVATRLAITTAGTGPVIANIIHAGKS